tara:strand:+ start:175 stop:789 length:615 start_codon:yes stop_codon:yes gene_type:complete
MASLGGKGLTPDQLKKVLQLADKEGITITNTIKGRNNLDRLRKRLGFKDGGLMAAIRKVDAEKKFKDGKTVEADPTFEAMIKRNGKKTEKKTEKKKSNKFSKVPTTGDFGALAANTRVPRLKKSTIVKREDPNKRRPKVSDFGPRKLGDSLLMPVLFSTLAKTGLMDKKDKVTHPMEAKKFSQGASVEAETNRGNTTKNFKGSF